MRWNRACSASGSCWEPSISALGSNLVSGKRHWSHMHWLISSREVASEDLPVPYWSSPDFSTSWLRMSCPSWQWHRTGSRWSPVRTLPVAAPLWFDLGFVPNSRGNKAAANPHPKSRPKWSSTEPGPGPTAVWAGPMSRRLVTAAGWVVPRAVIWPASTRDAAPHQQATVMCHVESRWPCRWGHGDGSNVQLAVTIMLWTWTSSFIEVLSFRHRAPRGAAAVPPHQAPHGCHCPDQARARATWPQWPGPSGPAGRGRLYYLKQFKTHITEWTLTWSLSWQPRYSNCRVILKYGENAAAPLACNSLSVVTAWASAGRALRVPAVLLPLLLHAASMVLSLWDHRATRQLAVTRAVVKSSAPASGEPPGGARLPSSTRVAAAPALAEPPGGARLPSSRTPVAAAAPPRPRLSRQWFPLLALIPAMTLRLFSGSSQLWSAWLRWAGPFEKEQI